MSLVCIGLKAQEKLIAHNFRKSHKQLTYAKRREYNTDTMTPLRYEFTNWTDDSFTGRCGGVDYTFAPGETRSFDPDKHYMLILLSMQLADIELNKRVKSVGRNAQDMETWGKALDAEGKPFTVTTDMRKVLMRRAIGMLADTPIPTPDDAIDNADAGETKGVSEDVKSLQQQVAELTNLVQSLSQGKTTQLRTNPVSVSDNEPAAQPVSEPSSMTRDVLLSMAADFGIHGTEHMTKEELIHAVSGRQAQI